METCEDQRVTYEELEIIQHMHHIFLSNSCVKNRINRLTGLKNGTNSDCVLFFVNLFCLNQEQFHLDSVGHSDPPHM